MSGKMRAGVKTIEEKAVDGVKLSMWRFYRKERLSHLKEVRDAAVCCM